MIGWLSSVILVNVEVVRCGTFPLRVYICHGGQHLLAHNTQHTQTTTLHSTGHQAKPHNNQPVKHIKTIIFIQLYEPKKIE